MWRCSLSSGVLKRFAKETSEQRPQSRGSKNRHTNAATERYDRHCLGCCDAQPNAAPGQERRIDDVRDVSGVLPIASVLQCVGDPRAVPADDFWLGRRRWSGTQNSRVLDCAHLFAGSHPKLARFGIGVALNRAGLASGNFCCDNSAVNAATLCSASASVAAVPRTCAMSSFKAVLSISIPLPSRGADNCIALKK